MHQLLENYDIVKKFDSHCAIILWWPKGSARGPAQYHNTHWWSISSFSLLIRQWSSQIYLTSRIFCIWGAHQLQYTLHLRST